MGDVMTEVTESGTDAATDTGTGEGLRHVSATLQAQLSGRSRLELQLAVAELPGLRVEGRAGPLELTEQVRILYGRPRRYAASDKLLGFARRQFGAAAGAGSAGTDLLRDVASWVGSRLSYVPGRSGPTDGASDTLLTGAGVCRDYAHLVIAMLRALDVPARLVAVYAPGCDPMDFHAVTEAAVDGQWLVVDATLLAPRQSLLRISTGRDAADTAWMTTFGGGLVLESSAVTADVDGDLPVDDTHTDVRLG